MKRNVIYFVDEDDAARRANARELRALIADDSIHVKAQEPFSTFADYVPLIADPATAAFILDQRMKGSGKVNYNGIDLARYLRGIDGKMPIYILTGHPDAEGEFDGSKHLVDHILAKSSIEQVDSESAKIVKARLLRQLDVFNDVRDDQEQRFHDLLVKSLQEGLTPAEQDEMNKLEGEATTPVLALERVRERELSANIEILRSLLGKGQSSL
jgi:DNA-binding LytR/AlgR family response regulator